MNAAIRVQTLSGTWETLGVDRYPGLFPQGIRPIADLGGPSAFSFTMNRDPDLPQLDLLAWTPCEVEIDGKTVWEGRIRETPGMHHVNEIAVQAEGWQAHWDDDSYEHTWVHQDLTAWVDSRSMPGQVLANYVAAPTIATANGTISIAIPNGTVLTANATAGITLDLGQYGGTAREIVADLVITGANAGLFFYKRSTDTPSWVGSGNIADTTDSAQAISNGTFTNTGGTLSGYRYCHIFIFTGAGLTVGAADVSLQITRILVATTTNAVQFGSSGTPSLGLVGRSDLRAADIILDAAAASTPLITATPRSPAYHDEIVADAPLSYWRLGLTAPPSDRVLTGGDYRTADLGTLNNPITSFGAGATNTTGLLIDDGDGAMMFSGAATATAAVGNPSLYAGGSASIEAIVTPAALTGVFMEILRCDGKMLLTVNASNRLEIDVWIGGGTTTFAANAVTLVVGTPHHIVAAYELNGTAFMWVDGVAAALTKTINTGTGTGTLGTATAIYIGCFGATQNFNGTIDEVSVYAFSLDAHTATNHYAAARARVYGGVQRTQFKIPSYAPVGAKTFREHASAVNALHGWRLKMLPGRQLMFQPQPAAVSLRATQNVEFHEAASNTGTDVYNVAVVEAADATGAPVRARVGAGQAFPNAPMTIDGVAQPSNPGFEVNTTGWTFTSVFGAPSFARVLSPHSGVGSGQLTIPVAGIGQISTIPTPTATVFRAGFTYVLKLWINLSVASAWTGNYVSFIFGGTADYARVDSASSSPGIAGVPAATWTPITLTWTPQTNQPASGVVVQVLAGAISGNPSFTLAVDDVSIARLTPTLLDRRNTVRTKILTANSAIDQTTATALATAFLQNNSSLPFRGDFIASSPDDVLTQPGDVPVAPSELLWHTGELIRLPLIDPNTGDIGRDGKIALVTYDDTTDQATVTIDDDRSSFTNLLNRMA